MQSYIHKRHEPPNKYERNLSIYVFLGSYIDLALQIYFVIFELLYITPYETF